LRKNRRILSDLYNDGKIKVHADALIALGYNFNFFTHIIQSTDGCECRYCFEFGYRTMENDFLEISFNGQYLEYQ
jgi:hypothetical protein